MSTAQNSYFWLYFGLFLTLSALGCGDNPNRQGNSAWTEPNNSTGVYVGIDSRIPSNESLGSMVIGRETTLTTPENVFMANTAEGNLAEAILGRLALAKSSDSDIRELANRLFDDREAIQDELLKLAANNATLLPYNLDTRQAAQIEALAKMSGDRFNREFIRLAIQSDQSSLASFRNAAANASDPSIRWFAQQLMWRHRQHLQMAERIQAKMRRQGEAARSMEP